MKLWGSVLMALVLSLAMSPLVYADDATPVPQSTAAPPVDVQPTQPAPVTDTAPTSVPEATQPQVDSTPVTVSREGSHPVTQVSGPVPVGPSPQPTAPQSAETPGAGALPSDPQLLTKHPSPSTGASGTAEGAAPAQAAPPSSVSDAGLGSSGNDATSSPDSNVSGLVYEPRSASTPAQLTCPGKHHPAAPPFLIAPYTGWTELMSFVDHDNPDYAVDGKIVLANGVTASASDGQASDMFPAYWSPSLRQYINYDGHNGYDFDISYQPVVAAASGTVEYAGWNGPSEYDGYGQMILLRHRDGYVTLYGHLSRVDVHQREHVVAGQQIGISGSTGHSSGPHLHFSAFHDCNVVDPYGWTGKGSDPLNVFDGETATYLWLPGHEPLVLNPPPNWPSYPLGLHVPVPADELIPGLVTGRVPVVDRLLLLALPAPHKGAPVPMGVALARTEARISEEAEAVTPQLDDLRSLGAIESYQVISAAAAIWVRGRASADELESLPGVASLTGVMPKDVTAAQTGLGHGVLIQFGTQHVPSLWPVAFRSALHPWHPVTFVVRDQALVAGLALPGQKVTITLHRGDTVPAAARAVADPQSGGFVAMLHDVSGNPVDVVPHDVVEVESSGRHSRVVVADVTLRVRSRAVHGYIAPGATVDIEATSPSGATQWRRIAFGDLRGRYSLVPKRPLQAGTLAVETVQDEAGNGESAFAFVPGLAATVGDSTVRGWTVGHGPRLSVSRAGKVVFFRKLHPSPDGTFQTAIEDQHQPLTLRAGDVLRIGSRWHQHTLVIPGLSVRLNAGSAHLSVAGPPSSAVSLAYRGYDGKTVVKHVRLDATGHAVATGPSTRTVSLGDTVIAQLVLAQGDTVRSVGLARGIVVALGSGQIHGRVAPSTSTTIRLLTRQGKEIGSAVATPAGDGSFAATVRSAGARPRVVLPGMHVVLLTRELASSFVVPDISVAVRDEPLALVGRASRRHPGVLQLVAHSGQLQDYRLPPHGDGSFTVPISLPVLRSLRSVRLEVVLDNGVTVERALPVMRALQGAARQPERLSGCSSAALSGSASRSCTTVLGRSR